MKSKALPLLAISILALTSCSLFSTKSSKAVNVGVYDLDVLETDDDLTKGYHGDVKARFINGEPLIPYLSLQQYASLYEPHLGEGFRNKVVKRNQSVSWSVYDSNNNLYFVTEINFLTKDVILGGNLQAALKKESVAQDTKALDYAMHVQYDAITTGSNYTTYSFANQKIKYFAYNNNYYISLGFLDMTYSYESSLYFHYNYTHIYSTNDPDKYGNLYFKQNNQEMTVNSEMADHNYILVMPQYLREYNGHLFLYFLDNLYGLKDYKNIGNATSYCKRIGVYNNLFSANDEKRVQAIADALSYLDDNHTALVSGLDAWGEDYFVRWKYGDGVKARSQLGQALTAARDEAYKYKTPGADIVYSDDGKTAMYMFNSFAFGTSEEVFNEDDSIKDTAYQFDTFINLISVFNEITRSGGVENVILDISTNGGGVVGVMMKILSLISPSPSSDIFYLEGCTNQVISANTSIDINNSLRCS